MKSITLFTDIFSKQKNEKDNELLYNYLAYFSIIQYEKNSNSESIWCYVKREKNEFPDEESFNCNQFMIESMQKDEVLRIHILTIYDYMFMDSKRIYLDISPEYFSSKLTYEKKIILPKEYSAFISFKEQFYDKSDGDKYDGCFISIHQNKKDIKLVNVYISFVVKNSLRSSCINFIYDSDKKYIDNIIEISKKMKILDGVFIDSFDDYKIKKIQSNMGIYYLFDILCAVNYTMNNGKKLKPKENYNNCINDSSFDFNYYNEEIFKNNSTNIFS